MGLDGWTGGRREGRHPDGGAEAHAYAAVHNTPLSVSIPKLCPLTGPGGSDTPTALCAPVLSLVSKCHSPLRRTGSLGEIGWGISGPERKEDADRSQIDRDTSKARRSTRETAF